MTIEDQIKDKKLQYDNYKITKKVYNNKINSIEL